MGLALNCPGLCAYSRMVLMVSTAVEFCSGREFLRARS